ncbi:uncharacterized protein B0I36DRAFT_298607 [Microdochium trichocladiopsis]|uniref:Uncharacterized protein n=1 Tax=Microdochium trichocladiopsis TaxID=1682393 RepID=A0A9P8XT63_9PEZI|nr:uncharacterized protein B0I36DRAFT_298607 [Microdochium trichocladiopsis]KAH7016291.1 hypothetical protein B0I36DRAFT_298607 [Microdochium trichocladiopsis]
MKTSIIIATAAALLVDTTTAASLERRADLVAADIVAQIAPSSKTCADARQCRTNVQVGTAMVEAFQAYDIYEPVAMASILALIALESVEFRYKRNLQSTNPAQEQEFHWGQGTSNMQVYKYNLEFAKSFNKLKGQVIPGDTMEAKNRVLDLVTADEYNFKSGPWFYAKQADCAPAREAAKGVKPNVDDVYQAHMKCVGVDTNNDERRKYWDAAKKAFNLA